MTSKKRIDVALLTTPVAIPLRIARNAVEWIHFGPSARAVRAGLKIEPRLEKFFDGL
jgi:hypothetical protein